MYFYMYYVTLYIFRSSSSNKLQQASAYPNNMRMGSMTPNRFTAAEILAAKRQNETLDNRIEGTVIAGKCTCHVIFFRMIYEKV